MLRIKESIHPSWKPGLISDGTYLEKAVRRVDGLGRRGIDVFKKHGIEVVRPYEKADYGISLHGDPVEGIPREKCILLKGEPPIYNIYFGWNLCNQKFLDKYMATLSNSITGNLRQIHFNSLEELLHNDFQLLLYSLQITAKPQHKFYVPVLKLVQLMIRVCLLLKPKRFFV